MKSSPSGWIVVGFTMAALSSSAMGFRWVYPLDMASIFANIAFFLGAYSLRQSFGEAHYRRIFSMYAFLLLPTLKLEIGSITVTTLWQIPLVLAAWVTALGLLWHFSKHLNLDDSDVRGKMFGPSMVELHALEART